MKLLYWLLLIPLFVIGPNPINKITDHNSFLKKATKLYHQGKYNEALHLFAYVNDSLQYHNPNIQINIASSLYQLDSTSKANVVYNALLADPEASTQIKSQGANQLGNIAEKKQKLEDALAFYKKALKLNPNNLKARYNYELTKKKLKKKKQNKKENEDQKGGKSKKDKQKKDKKDQKDKKNRSDKEDNKDKSKDSKDGKKSDQKDKKKKKKGQNDQKKSKDGKKQKGKQNKEDKLGKPKQIDNLKMSEQRAKMLLEAMKENETKYIQNMKKRGERDPDVRPDW